jgi:hypothetical protein
MSDGERVQHDPQTYVRESTARPSPRPKQTPEYHASDQFVRVVCCGVLVAGLSQGLTSGGGGLGRKGRPYI